MTASAAVLACLIASVGMATADPADDPVSKLTELSRQAVQSRAELTAAQRDLDAKIAGQADADQRHRADLAALSDADAQLLPLQAAVDQIAVMRYLGGGGGQFAAILTAASPHQLIDQLAIQRTVDAGVTDRVQAYRAAQAHALSAAQASEKSAAAATAAAGKATAVRDEFQAKLRELLARITAAETQYAALTPQQQTVVDNLATPAVALPGIASPPPPEAATPNSPDALPVGVASESGLQPNTILAARAVSAQFPQISEIDGVRPDSKPWHPSGLAIDIMIPNPDSPEGIALGDQILAFALSNAGRFGLQDVIWRGTYYTPSGPQASGYGHYDHVHITTTPR